MRIALTIIACVLIAVFASAVSAGSATSSNISPLKSVKGTNQNFGVGGGLFVEGRNGTVGMQSTATARLSFLLVSGVQGTFAFSIAAQGETIRPPQTLEGISAVPTFRLPSYVSVSFPGGNVRQGSSNETITVVIATAAAPSGHIPLELVVFQQQGPALMAETTFPITINVG